MSEKKEYISPAGLRLDGRRPQESRRMTLEFGKVLGCDGCCTVMSGLATVCASVYGPREVTNRLESKYNECIITCEVAIAAFAGEKRRAPQRRSKLSEEMSAAVLEVARSVVLLSQYPNSQIHICVEVLRQDGSDKAACINAACLALVDASVAMRDIVYAQTVGLIHAVDVVDLTTEEMRSQCPTICIAVKGHDPSSIVWMESNCRVTSEVISRLVTVAQKSSEGVFEAALRGPLEEHAAAILKLQGNLGNSD
ncbi:exosome complex exonuclease RRP41A, putative [Trypanosoma cruzi]|uniref:Exosome complex exonuclease RRP41A n=2 Tax=Trypanosoma cruzi TaxID=5693 RepID=V5BKB5_TRYCR|nr:exosome complex exonuclease RRP41A, putative [Trypanosoma cruzi]ESS66547.1 exosome complex exonuclease RRP41A [Trypanosoma cruzi Dm28c]PBJ77598.1 ribosomal RNA processing protein 41A,3' [Trypanosoma cruzi cruzi]KAF8305748.1 Ribosomal RNA processing protein 41A [Trypanosoma cruzi]PWU89696.1 Ribosomal RNA processing protein 41A [Trypanosoma cruzi]